MKDLISVSATGIDGNLGRDYTIRFNGGSVIFSSKPYNSELYTGHKVCNNLTDQEIETARILAEAARVYIYNQEQNLPNGLLLLSHEFIEK